MLGPLKVNRLLNEQMCYRWLQAALPIWLPFYDQGESPLEKGTRQKLLSMGPVLGVGAIILALDRWLTIMSAERAYAHVLAHPKKGCPCHY